jgi:hypothetical protein
MFMMYYGLVVEGKHLYFSLESSLYLNPCLIMFCNDRNFFLCQTGIILSPGRLLHELEQYRELYASIC